MVDFTQTYTGILALGNFLIPFIAIFPFFLNLRYFQKTKIKDYLFLMMYFAYWTIAQIVWIWLIGIEFFSVSISGYSSNPAASATLIEILFFVFRLWDPIDALPLAIIAIRSKYETVFEDTPKYMLGLLAIPIVLSLANLSPTIANTVIPPNTESTFWFLAIVIGRIIYYGITAYCFLSTKHARVGRAQFSRKLWIWSSLFWIWAMIAFFIQAVVLNIAYGTDPLTDILTFVGFMPAMILLLYNHIFLPESVLITPTQIHNALNLYKNIETSGNRIKDIGIAHIKSYLDQIPDDLK